jgi:hypothetical protein
MRKAENRRHNTGEIAPELKEGSETSGGTLPKAKSARLTMG